MIKSKIQVEDSGDMFTIRFIGRKEDFILIDSMGDEMIDITHMTGSSISINKSNFCPGVYCLTSVNRQDRKVLLI